MVARAKNRKPFKRHLPPKPVARFQNNFTKKFLCLFTKIAKMIPLGWTELKHRQETSFPAGASQGLLSLLALHRVFFPCCCFTDILLLSIAMTTKQNDHLIDRSQAMTPSLPQVILSSVEGSRVIWHSCFSFHENMLWHPLELPHLGMYIVLSQSIFLWKKK